MFRSTTFVPRLDQWSKWIVSPIVSLNIFKFQLKVRYRTTLNKTYQIIVGNEKKPCLDLIIRMPQPTQPKDMYEIANLDRIANLRDCLIEPISNNEFENGHFGRQLMIYIIDYIKRFFPHVKYLTLNDTSIVPCNLDIADTLDLISYYTAKYGESWYEKNFSAKPLHHKEIYKSEVDEYKTSAIKNKYSFDEFIEKYIANNKNQYAYEYILTNYNDIKLLWDKSINYPVFFQNLSKYIDEINTCKFFFKWLEDFILEHINITRHWIIDLSMQRLTRTSAGGHRRTRNKTMKYTIKRIKNKN